MSDRLDILINSDRKVNWIPLGRQLPRTPPLQDPTKRLNFHSEEVQQLTEINNEENQDPNRTGFRTPPVKQDSSDDPQSMLKGMKGYQLTPSDIEFMQKMKEAKELKKLQDNLKEVKKLFKCEMMALELALASKERAEHELHQFPSLEEIWTWCKVVLELTEPSAEITELDTKSLLALVTKQNAQKAVQEKNMALKELQKRVEKKRKKDARDRGLLEKQIAVEQSKIHSLMNKLSELKSELARLEDTSKTLKPPEVIAKATKSRVKSKDGKVTAKPEKPQDATNQNKPQRKANNRTTVVKDEPAKATPVTQKPAKATPVTQKPAKATPVTQKPAKATPVTQKPAKTVPQESTVKGKGAASDPQPNTQKKVEPKAISEPAAPARRRKKAPSSVSANEEEKNMALRRSKRIACRK